MVDDQKDTNNAVANNLSNCLACYTDKLGIILLLDDKRVGFNKATRRTANIMKHAAYLIYNQAKTILTVGFKKHSSKITIFNSNIAMYSVG